MKYNFISIAIYIFTLTIFLLNANEIVDSASLNNMKSKEMINEVEPIDNDYKYSLENNNDIVYNTGGNINNNKQSLVDNVYGHVGFFGKTNELNSDYKNDHYAVFSGSVGLKYMFNNEIRSKISLNLGIYVMTDLYKNKAPNKYVESKFVTHNAFLKINDTFYELKMGRYKATRDWIKHYVQGISINATYSWLNFWGEWIDDQAYINREMLTDFNLFQKNYKNEWLIATGLDTDFYGINISPYYYLLNKNLWVAGSKIGFKKEINDEWRTKTFIHYAYLESKTGGKYGPINNNTSSNIIKNGTSSILWIDQEISYKIDKDNMSSNVLFGLGFIKVWGSEFELAKIGNKSHFETSDYRSYSVIETGGVNNGYNSTNTFSAQTTTVYGFAGFRINELSMMLLGRDSRSIYTKQQSYSIGGKYKIINGFYIGGLVAYMLENNKNKSFAKAYIEFVI